MFASNEFLVKCDKGIMDEVKSLLTKGLEEQGYSDVVIQKGDDLALKDLLYRHLAEFLDGKVVYIEDYPAKKIGPGDVFRKVKEQYPDVELGGIIEIGDDNSRNFFLFNSPKGDTTVLEDYAFDSEDQGEWIPLSECWFSYVARTDYAPDLVAFETKEAFESFLEAAKESAADNDMSFEEFLYSEEFDDFLSDNDYIFPEYENERKECYELVMKKYKG